METIRLGGAEYKVLDPVVMLKAKAANVRDIKQDDTPPRHDREHLQLLARCVPIYLRKAHETAVTRPELEKETLAVVSHAFKTLQNVKTSRTLQAEGIMPASLIPSELAESPLPRIRTAFEWQFRLLAGAKEKPRKSIGIVDTPPAAKPNQGPRMIM